MVSHRAPRSFDSVVCRPWSPQSSPIAFVSLFIFARIVPSLLQILPSVVLNRATSQPPRVIACLRGTPPRATEAHVRQVLRSIRSSRQRRGPRRARCTNSVDRGRTPSRRSEAAGRGTARSRPAHLRRGPNSLTVIAATARPAIGPLRPRHTSPPAARRAQYTSGLQ